MKTLLILRHAKSSWGQPDLDDHDRPLNKRGKLQAPEMGRLVRDEGLVPDRMLSSTARRARKTAEVVAEVCGYDGKIVMTPDFYPGDPSAYIRVLRSLPDEVQRVMVVGHNPGLEALLAVLTGERRPLATAALAQVELPIEKWQELNAQIATRGRLVNLWRPVEGK